MAKLEQFLADHLLLMGAVGIGIACLQVSEVGDGFPLTSVLGKAAHALFMHVWPCPTPVPPTPPPFPLQPKMNHSVSLIPQRALNNLNLSGTGTWDTSECEVRYVACALCAQHSLLGL